MDAQTPVDEFAPTWRSFADFFGAGLQDGERVFLVELDRDAGTRSQWTRDEWSEQVLRTADWLRSQGVGEGGAVATLAGNSAAALRLAYAAWVVGACCVPLNPADDLGRQTFILRDSGAQLLVHSDAAAEHAARLAEASGARAHRSVEAVGEHREAEHPSAGLEVAALRVYTSGTTGQPKGVVLTARNLLVDCDGLRQRLDWPADTRILTVLPVHHVNGLVISSLLPWFSGLSTVLCDRFRIEHFWQDAREEGATVSSLVPTILEFLLQGTGSSPADLREVLCGAGPLLSDTVLDFEERFQVPVRHLYGLSETTAVATLTPRLSEETRRHWHRAYGTPAIGPAIPHVEVAVHDADGRDVESGERGELVIRGDVVMAGYAGSPEADAEVFRGGWFHSGDEGFWVQEPGQPPYFFITGRLKELIIRGGANISPLEVDAVLRSHPSVSFALAVPFENRFYGEEIAAYVVVSAPVTDEEILVHCARYLDHARTPKVVIQGDDIPYTATGKAKRLELKRRLAPQLEAYREQQFRRSRSGTAATSPARPVPAALHQPAGDEVGHDTTNNGTATERNTP